MAAAAAVAGDGRLVEEQGRSLGFNGARERGTQRLLLPIPRLLTTVQATEVLELSVFPHRIDGPKIIA